eukprot:351043-Chlamydomonas_euryale.AAC.4
MLPCAAPSVRACPCTHVPSLGCANVHAPMCRPSGVRVSMHPCAVPRVCECPCTHVPSLGCANAHAPMCRP